MPVEASPTVDEVIDALETIAQHGVPAPGSAWITDVGTQQYLSFFASEILDGLMAGAASTCRFFEAVYGGGKTHVLDLLSSLAFRRQMVVVRTDLSQAVNLDDWKLVTRHVLENISVQIDGQLVRSLPRVLAALADTDLARTAELSTTRLPHPGFGRAMYLVASASFPSGQSREYLERYLLGDRVGAIQLRRLGIRRVNEPLSKRNAEQVLATVVNGLRALGVPGVMILFDENEKTFEMRGTSPPKRVVTAANLIRRLIDSCVLGDLQAVVVVFAVLPGFLERCAQAYAALGQRVAATAASRESRPWRWPTLELRALSEVESPEIFAQLAIHKMIELIEHCGVNPGGVAAQMHRESRLVLESHAGEGYRRPLMKALATAALREVSP